MDARQWPGFQQEHRKRNTAISIYIFTAGLQKLGEFGNTQITFHEINNTPLPH